MGPYEILIAHGANIVAVDLDRKNIWERLLKLTRASCGRLVFPLKVVVFFPPLFFSLALSRPDQSSRLGWPTWLTPAGVIRRPPLQAAAPKDATDEWLAANAGGNLFTQTPEIKNWVVATLASLAPAGAAATVGGYAYLDGELHVRVSLAMDAIMAGVAAARPGTRLAYLCSPTDVFVIQDDAYAAMQQNHKRGGLLALFVGLVRKVAPQVR